VLKDMAGKHGQRFRAHQLLFTSEVSRHLGIYIIEERQELSVFRLSDALEQGFQDRMVLVHQWHP